MTSNSTYYQRTWPASPSGRLMDPRSTWAPKSVLDNDPFFRRQQAFSGSLESLHKTGGVGGNTMNNNTSDTKYSYSYSNTSPKSEERIYVDDKDKLTIVLDLPNFTADEIKVRVANGMLVIDASHGEIREERGLVSRSLIRRYPLPKDVDAQKVTSELTKSGFLTIKAPKYDVHQLTKEHVIPVHTVATSVITKGGISRKYY